MDEFRVTDEQLAQLDVLAHAATPGPVRAVKLGEDDEWAIVTDNWGTTLAQMLQEGDAKFYAAARNAAPAMIAEIRKLRAALREIQEISDSMGVGYYEFHESGLTPETLAALRGA